MMTKKIIVSIPLKITQNLPQKAVFHNICIAINFSMFKLDLRMEADSRVVVLIFMLKLGP